MTTESWISLTKLPREIAALTGSPSPGYRKIYAWAVDNKLPAEHRDGRWYVRAADLEEIAVALGLTIPVVAA